MKEIHDHLKQLSQVVANEIGWLDFYAASASKFCVKRRSKQHPIQAEKEIILYTVLTVCYDVIAGFAHYNNSAQQPLDAKLLDFLLQRYQIILRMYWKSDINVTQFLSWFLSISLVRVCCLYVWRTTGQHMIKQGMLDLVTRFNLLLLHIAIMSCLSS